MGQTTCGNPSRIYDITCDAGDRLRKLKSSPDENSETELVLKLLCPNRMVGSTETWITRLYAFSPAPQLLVSSGSSFR